MADKTTRELERIYTIPLREVKSSPRNHRTDRAVRAVKNYLSRHMKSEQIWLDGAVNEKLWERGMYKIPSKIRVRALKFDDGVVEVTLPETDITTSVRAERARAREEREAAKEKKPEKEAEEKKEGEAKEGEEKPAAAPAKAPEKKEGEAKEGEEKPPAAPAKAPEKKEGVQAKEAEKPAPKADTAEKKEKPASEGKAAPKVGGETGTGTKDTGSPGKTSAKKE